jgi:hypothetical protein
MKTAVVQAQQKWETKAITRKTDSVLAEEMNELGEHGWEMVTAFYYKDAQGNMTWTAFLKRPKIPQAAKGPSHAAAAESQGQAAGRPEEEAAQAAGFDLSGEVFDVKKSAE